MLSTHNLLVFWGNRSSRDYAHHYRYARVSCHSTPQTYSDENLCNCHLECDTYAFLTFASKAEDWAAVLPEAQFVAPRAEDWTAVPPEVQDQAAMRQVVQVRNRRLPG